MSNITNFAEKLFEPISQLYLFKIEQYLSQLMNNEEKQKYSAEELKEFEDIINQKLEEARNELTYIKGRLSRKHDQGVEGTIGGSKLMEDSADASEKENMNQLAARLQKFIQQLEMAIVRIKNGTYGICVDTGKLIPKDRLRAVPHTRHSIEAKLAKQ